MGIFTKKSPWLKEWEDLNKREAKFANKRKEGPTSVLINKLDRFVPEKLNETLNSAFFKGFELIFEKGTGVIEKTYDKAGKEHQYQVNDFAQGLKTDRKTVKTFTKEAKSSKMKNMLVSGAEGVGLGLVGAGIPDIPIFIGVLLKSVYEVALSYGYDYESDCEKVFILKVIETAMMDDDEFMEADEKLNSVIDRMVACTYSNVDDDFLGELAQSKVEQMKATADSLSKEMIYTKFLQGQMVVGVLGGIFNPIYVNRVTDYALLKYRRRFIKSKAWEADIKLDI